MYVIKHLYIIFPKINGCIKNCDGNKYLTLVPDNEEGKDSLKIRKIL